MAGAELAPAKEVKILLIPQILFRKRFNKGNGAVAVEACVI